LIEFDHGPKNTKCLGNPKVSITINRAPNKFALRYSLSESMVAQISSYLIVAALTYGSEKKTHGRIRLWLNTILGQ